MLVSRRYERASLIVTSNKPFSAWGEIFGDDVTAAAMIDRLVHHAEILALKGDSYRLKDRDLARATSSRRGRPNSSSSRLVKGWPDARLTARSYIPVATARTRTHGWCRSSPGLISKPAQARRRGRMNSRGRSVVRVHLPPPEDCLQDVADARFASSWVTHPCPRGIRSRTRCTDGSSRCRRGAASAFGAACARRRRTAGGALVELTQGRRSRWRRCASADRPPPRPGDVLGEALADTLAEDARLRSPSASAGRARTAAASRQACRGRGRCAIS